MASITKYHGKKGVTYKATVRFKGYPTQSQSFKRKTDAKDWAEEVERAIRDQQFFPSRKVRKRTLGELIDKYVKESLPKQPKSEKKKKAQLDWWKNELGDRPLLSITSADLSECRNKLEIEPYVTLKKIKQKDGSVVEQRTERKRKPCTANRYIAALSSVFKIAVKEWRWLENNPFQNVSRNKESDGEARFLSDDERERLLSSCKQSRNKDLYLIALLDISSGGRFSEIMGLKWDDVSFDLRRIILRKTKNGETRAVPLVGKAFDFLKERYDARLESVELVFPSKKNPNKPMSIRGAWENAVARAGIKNFRFHDMRHTTASYLAMNGATLAEIAEVLGHKTLQMVKRYAHLSEQHTLSVVERMNRKVFGE